jgi:PAS domain S-box-containing protein
MISTDKNSVSTSVSDSGPDRHFAAIVESTHDAIVSKNLDGIIQSWNPAAENIFGYTAGEAIGKSVTMLMPEGHEDEEPKILARVRRGEKIDHYETVRQRKDGSLVNISLTVSPIKNASGKIIGASKIARDVTEQKRVEQKMHEVRGELATLNRELEHRVMERTASLNEAINQLEEFSYSVSHDLRSPARAMEAYAKAVIEDYGPRLDARGLGFLQKIVRSSGRMDKLIQDLLTYTRVLRSDVSLKSVELAPLLRDILDQYPEMQAPHAQIRLQDGLGVAMAHEASLTQALSNLLSNAVKFVNPKTIPQIDIRSECRNGKVRLWIADNGIGIKPEFQSRLFRMFERINPGMRYEGTGIGLAIVKKAVERMGGTVGVESDGVTGTSFWIELSSASTRPAQTI